MSEAVVCTLSPEDQRERAAQLRAGLFRNLTHSERLPGAAGMRLHFDPRSVVRADLEEFVGFESRCCGFADFAIEECSARSLALRVSGPEGTQEFVASWLEAAAPGRMAAVAVQGATGSSAPLSPGTVPRRATPFAWFSGAALLCCAAPALTALGFAGVARTLGASFEWLAFAAAAAGFWALGRRFQARRSSEVPGSAAAPKAADGPGCRC